MRSFTRRLAPALLLLLALSDPSAHAAPRTDAEIEEAARSMLMNRHPEDTAEAWRGLGPAAPAVIIRMYPPLTNTFHRMRLLEGLGAFPEDAAAVAFIKEQAESSQEYVVRNVAIKAVGASQGVKEEEFLSRFLRHDNPHTRVAAAEALRRIGTPGALARVNEQMAAEKTPWVVSKLKGEPIKQSGKLTPSGSSEDALSPDLKGEWTGYWVSPRKEGGGMKSEPAKLRLEVTGATTLKGWLTYQSDGKERAVAVERPAGKGLRWSATLVEEIPATGSAKARREERPCEAEAASRGGNWITEIRLPKDGAVLVLRKS